MGVRDAAVVMLVRVGLWILWVGEETGSRGSAARGPEVCQGGAMVVDVRDFIGFVVDGGDKKSGMSGLVWSRTVV